MRTKKIRLLLQKYCNTLIFVFFISMLILVVHRNHPEAENTIGKKWCSLYVPTDNSSAEMFEEVVTKEAFILSHTGYRSQTGNYVMHHHFRPSTLTISDALVTLATFTTINRIHHILWLMRAWTGPVSVSVYTPGNEFTGFVVLSLLIRKCAPDLDSRITYHIMYPEGDKPSPNLTDANIFFRNFTCDSVSQLYEDLQPIAEYFKIDEHYKEFPQNHLRNLARQSTSTKHCLLLNIDMIPTPTMYDRLNLMLARTKLECKKCVLIVPVYEINDSQPMLPATKSTLLNMISDGTAQQYHITVNKPNQANSKLNLWEKANDNYSSQVYWNLDGLSNRVKLLSSESLVPYDIMYSISSYQEFWEPIIITTITTPYFAERFVGYGFTRSSLIYELHVKGYSFYVLNEAFLSHWGFQSRKEYPKHRITENRKNHVRYMSFKSELNARYTVEPKKKSPKMKFRTFKILKNKPK